MATNILAGGPASTAAAVTASDTAEIGNARGLYIGGTGDVKVKTALGDTVTFAGVPAGAILPIECVLVYSTDTTATDIVAFLEGC